MKTIHIIKGLIYALAAYTSISIDVYAAYSLLMILDTSAGFVKGIRIDAFSFKTLIAGVVTKMAMLSIPLAVAAFAHVIDVDQSIFYITNGAIGLLAGNEFISFLSNMYTIRTKIELTNTDYISTAILALRSAVGRYIEGLIEAINTFKSRR